MKIAIAAVIAVLLLLGAVAGSYALSLQVAHQSNERLCSTFAYFIRKPVPPFNTALKKQQETQYLRLLEFERRLGC